MTLSEFLDFPELNDYSFEDDYDKKRTGALSCVGSFNYLYPSSTEKSKYSGEKS